MSAADYGQPVKTPRRAAAGPRPWSKYKDSELHPKKRIFLSIDAIGATNFKSSLTDQGSTPDVWARGFLAFLPEVVVVYRNKLGEAISNSCRDACKQPCMPETMLGKAKSFHHTVNVWKYIGDEVVLVAELTCQKYHASLHVAALAETIRHFNNEFAKRPEPDNKLRFKGTAWVAGFPVANIELNLPGPTKAQMVKDFLGPSIDLGFRLSKFASEDRLVVSASLAHLIVSAPAFVGKKEEFCLPLCFGGLVEAKGVKNGVHPLIWHSVNSSAESRLCLVSKEKLLPFLRKEHFKGVDILPFIIDDGDANPRYDEEYIKAVDAQKKIPNSIFFPKRKPRAASSAKKATEAASKNLSAASIVKRIPPKV